MKRICGDRERNTLHQSNKYTHKRRAADWLVRHKQTAKKCCRTQIHPKNDYDKNLTNILNRPSVQREYTQQYTQSTVTESTRSNMKSRWKRTDRISDRARTRRKRMVVHLLYLFVCLFKGANTISMRIGHFSREKKATPTQWKRTK